MTELESLFDICMGNKFDLNKMGIVSDGIAFVSRTSKDNGVVERVIEVKGIEPFTAGLITVALGGSVLSSFVQPEAFYTGQNVAVLQPKSLMSLSMKLYYCYVISLNAYRYSTCGREANRTLKGLIIPSADELPSWIGSLPQKIIHNYKQSLADMVKIVS